MSDNKSMRNSRDKSQNTARRGGAQIAPGTTLSPGVSDDQRHHPRDDRQKERAYDAYLVAIVQTGDHQNQRTAMAQLAARWRARLYRHAVRLTGEADLGADVAQDAWADIIAGIRGLSNQRLFPAWAFQIVTRRAADVIRKRQKTRRLKNAAETDAVIASQGVGAENAGGEKQTLKLALGQAMASLPREQRAVLALHYAEGLTITEVAVAMKIPEGTVRSRLMRAKSVLRQKLETTGSIQETETTKETNDE